MNALFSYITCYLQVNDGDLQDEGLKRIHVIAWEQR